MAAEGEERNLTQVYCKEQTLHVNWYFTCEIVQVDVENNQPFGAFTPSSEKITVEVAKEKKQKKAKNKEGAEKEQVLQSYAGLDSRRGMDQMLQ